MIIGIGVLFAVNRILASVVLIIYLLYWTCRLIYMMLLLVVAHKRVHDYKDVDWRALCREHSESLAHEDIVHIILYPIYKEPQKLIETSMAALARVNFPKEQMIVVLAGEMRDTDAEEKLNAIKEQFAGTFRDLVITVHPDGIPGEIPSKGANATYAARQMKTYCDREGIAIDHAVVSCFDVDTKPDEQYFACLTYHFISSPNRHQLSYQPFPIYSNNIYEAGAFARVVELGSTFWQLIESMRYEKFITFSSHSMSFKTLVDVDYWPVDMISDDSVIFWKGYLHHNGCYRTYPLEVPVYMDIATGSTIVETVVIQYKQKRRWAWGVENFVFLAMAFSKTRRIAFLEKTRRLFQLLEVHVQWATWAVIISFMTPLIIFWGKYTGNDILILCNLSYINSVISNALFFIILLCIIISMQFLPPRPKHISRFFYVYFLVQWIFLPVISAFLGSFPALDAQTRLMCGKYLSFYRTPKGKT